LRVTTDLFWFGVEERDSDSLRMCSEWTPTHQIKPGLFSQVVDDWRKYG
jgi:hypothetical protein